MDALTINNIEKVLDERVRPSLAQHGGDIQIEKLEDVTKVARNQSDPTMFNKIAVFFE